MGERNANFNKTGVIFRLKLLRPPLLYSDPSFLFVICSPATMPLIERCAGLGRARASHPPPIGPCVACMAWTHHRTSPSPSCGLETRQSPQKCTSLPRSSTSKCCHHCLRKTAAGSGGCTGPRCRGELAHSHRKSHKARGTSHASPTCTSLHTELCALGPVALEVCHRSSVIFI